MTISHQRLELIFDELLDCPTAQRVQRGKELCAGNEQLWREVESLLDAAEKSRGFLSAGRQGVSWHDLPTLNPGSLRGQRFGAYELVHELGRGGMGVVYLAERVDGHYQSQVAIKVANQNLASVATVRQFHAERQLLARLQHPNIAQLLDGGTSNCGHPYLVMEFIAGTAIDHYCELQNLSLEKRLKLIAQVCEGVQYAHRNLVVHCDLKPANILVTAEGIPKLLDFGIAKLLNPALTTPTPPSQPKSHPKLGQTPATEGDNEPTALTPEFASPEQLRGKAVTTSSDVYSLGVILYQLLSGQLPERSSQPLLPPSSVAPPLLRKKISGDLDKLVQKAMHADPAQRYASIQQLGEDIHACLEGQPLLAANQTVHYLVGKFVRKHRWGVLGGALAIVFLLLGSVISTWQWQKARQNQVQAEHRFKKVHELTSLMVFELPQNIADLPGSTALQERLIRRGIQYLDELAEANVDDAKLQRDLATAYYRLSRLQGNPGSTNLGDPELAADTLNKAIAIQEYLLRTQPENLAISYELAESYSTLSVLEAGVFGNKTRGIELASKCVNLMDAAAGERKSRYLGRLLRCFTLTAHWYSTVQEFTLAGYQLLAAEKRYRDLQAIDHAFLQSRESQTIRARMHEEWAEVKSRTGEPQAALAHEKQRLQIYLNHFKSKQVDRHIGAAAHALGARRLQLKHYAEALEAYHLALRHWQNWQNNFPADVSSTQALAVIHAELAALHNQMASEASLPDGVASALEQECQHYRNSLQNLALLPDAQADFPLRYTWSPTPGEIHSRIPVYCQ